jgi:hypothetical protein
MKQNLLIVLILTFSAQLFAQNSSDYFRANVLPQSTDPAWVQLMYSANPHVPTVVKLHNAYYAENVFEKNTHTQNYKHWLKQIESITGADGYIHPLSIQAIEKEFLDKQKLYDAKQALLKKTRTAGANTQWVNIGPNQTFDDNTGDKISHQVNVYKMDVCRGNTNFLVAGTEDGGILNRVIKAKVGSQLQIS